jgi:hypothetical protein
MPEVTKTVSSGQDRRQEMLEKGALKHLWDQVNN